jgi:hypothetical protein
VFEVAIPLLVGRSVVERINQINTDGDREIYNPLTNCIVLDKNSPCFGCIHIMLCTYHNMIDKLFSTKVKITDTNRIMVEYCNQWGENPVF